MGTDIHYWAERKGESGWEHCPVDFYCGDERNYALFAILAAVQRMTNGGFEPIVPPRGFPPDSPLAAKSTEGGGYYHNETWLSLRELLDFPWHEKKRELRGLQEDRTTPAVRRADRRSRLQ
jgi:hypothetical protein